jgi:hypothetical protein
MVSPWNGPRHRSWASNSVVAGISLGLLLATTLAVDYFGEPPTYLTGLLGTAAGAFFTALGSDKAKRDADVVRTAERAESTANRAEIKADTLGRVAAREHPDEQIIPPFDHDETTEDPAGGGRR